MNLTGLVSWLKFDKSPTDDFIKKNHWEVFGNPTIGTENAINGNALQLDGQSCIKLSGIELGEDDFEIDGWVYVDSTSPDYARLIHIVNPTNGNALISVRKSPTDSTKLAFWANSTADVSQDNGYTYTSNTVSVGVKVHFKLIYQYLSYIKLCINDKIVAKWQSGWAAKIEHKRQSFDIYIGGLPYGNQNIIGSIDEITIYNGTWYSHNNGNVPTADYYAPPGITLNADTARKVLNPPLTWRYENYGSADLLTQTGTTITNLPATQSKTGSAFYQPTRAKCFDIPATKEIWLKCDIYTTANYANNDRIRIYSEDSNSVNGWCTYATITDNYALWHNGTSQAGAKYFAKNKLRSILLHMISDSTNGVVEYFFTSGTTDKFTGNVNNGEDFANVYIQMDGSNILVSNLIISNAPLEITDDVAELHYTTVELTADTLRLVGNTLVTSNDLVRNVINPVNFSFDSLLKISKSLNLSAAILSSICRTIDLIFDAERNIYSVNLFAEREIFDTERKIVKSLDLSFDTFRLTEKIWRYENYGISALLSNSSGTNTIIVPKTQSKYYIAFWSEDSFKCFDVPVANEIWLKFDAYAEKSFDVKNSTIDEEENNGVEIQLDGVWFFNDDDYQNVNYNWATDRLHTCLLHMKAGNTDGLIEFWIDEEKIVSHIGNVNNGKDFSSLSITRLYGTYNNNYVYAFSNVIISNDRIGFNENTKRPLEIYFDTERKTGNSEPDDNTWKYENYGTTDLLSVDAVTVAVPQTQSKYYSGFYQTQKAKTFEVPSSKEVWIKFDFYVEKITESKRGNKGWSLYIGEISQNGGAKSGICISHDIGTYSYHIYFFQNGGSSNGSISGNIEELDSDLVSCLVHMKSHTEMGIVEVWFNGEFKDIKIGNVNNGNDFENLCLHTVEYFQDVSPNKEILYSNIIISNAEIGLNENVKYPIELTAETTRLLFSMWTGDIWRYENYGTNELLAVKGIKVELSKSAAKYQVGFYSTAGRQNYFDIPATKEVWIKFDFWFTNIYETLFVGSLDNEKYNQVRLNCTGVSSAIARIIFALSENVVSDTANQFNKEQRYSAVLHLKSDETNGKIELTVGDGHNLNYTGNVNNGNDFENIYIQASLYNNISTYPLVSNVIISNVEVEITENAKMPLNGYYDLLRNIYRTFEYQCFFDSNRNVTNSKILKADLCRKINFVEKIDNETCRNVISYEEIDFDIAKTMPHEIKVMALTNKRKLAVLADSFDSDVVITPTPENTTEGLQKIEINLSAQQLTDQITYTSTLPVNIMEQVNGIYLDYLFNVRIEKIQRQGVLNTCYCCSDIDELLYKQLSYYVPATERKWSSEPLKGGAKLEGHSGEPIKVALATALTHMQRIANVLGKNLLSYFADFTSTLDVLQNGGKTYQDLIREIFGWTSRIPTMLINCFLRDDKLFVVQRGYEPNEIDLTNTKHTMPIISQSLMRTFWSANVWSKTNTKTEYLGFPYSYWVPDDSGSGESGGSSEPTTSPNRVTAVDTKDGLVHGTKIENADGSYTEVTYQYETADNGQVYLVAEIERTYELSKEGSWELIGEQVTTHEPQNTGQSIAHKNDQDGEFIGSSISKAADQRPTEYVYPFRSTKVAHLVDPKMTTTTTIYGITPFDTSFPVAGKEKLIELTDAIKWLNRRTQEKITMTIYDYPHLIDFTDRIIFEGEVYFLESNTVITTPRIINQQTVTFVRWF